MSKIIVIFVIFFINSSLGEELYCDFLYFDEDGYNCKMKENFDEPTEITSVGGDHKYGYDINDLRTFYVPESTKSRYLPTKVCDVFKKLTKIDVEAKTLVEIKKEFFEGCDKVETVHFKFSNFPTFDEDLFSNLPELKEVSITHSDLETLPKDLFKNNQKLTSINLDKNKLKTIEIELTPEQKDKVKKFTMFENVCINEGYRHEDYRSPPLSTVLAQLDEKCRVNSLSPMTTASPDTITEDPQEARIIMLEDKVDELSSNKRSIEEQVQTGISNINQKLTTFDYRSKALRKDLDECNDYYKVNLTVTVKDVLENYENLYLSINKIQERSRSLEVKTDGNSIQRSQNEQLQLKISHNKVLIISVACVQVVTIGFAIFITIFFKVFSKRT